MVRNNAGGTRTSTDGDYEGLQGDGSGNLRVTVTGAVYPGNAAAALGKSIDAAVGGSDVGVAALVKRQDTLATLTPASGDYAPPQLTSRGALHVTEAPDDKNGLSFGKWISAATTNATSVKASAGRLYGVQVHNTNGTVRYLKLYDKASAPTVGTDVPKKIIAIPPALIIPMVIQFGPGLQFANGIAFALTTGVADADTGAVGANEIVVNLDWY